VVEVLLLQLEDLACQGLTQVDDCTATEGVEVDCINEVLADRDLRVEALGFAQGHLTHLIDEVLIGDDVTRAPDLEVTLLLDVDDDVKGIVRAKHLRQDIAEGILHDRDQRIAVDTLELLILEERFDQAGSLFLLCHGAII
jgi:hypothetical protein